VPTLIPVDGACDPDDTSDRCDGGTSCLGGPAPRAFTCTTVNAAGLGGACVADSTDRVCAGIAACEASVCTLPPPSTTHDFTGRVVAGQEPTAAGRTRSATCAVENRQTRFAFVAFGVENDNAVDATVTATTSGTTDTTMSVSIPRFDDTDPGAGCVTADDDISNRNLNSQFTFALPPQTSAEIVVMGFNAGATFDFGLNLTSDIPVVALPR
jgi:hypothetical protein